ncbi:MAG: enoyl-CoA hydratase/isomerase family protein [Promethearchaeota archaeon]
MDLDKFKLIILEKKDTIMILKLNRPEKKNALSLALRAELLEALDLIKETESIRSAIIYGGEEVFCAGFDIEEIQASLLDLEGADDFINNLLTFHQKFFEFPKLLIAAVNGYAVAGGFDLAVLCHLRVASKNAVFGHPEIKFGACPLFFPYMTLVGRGKALELALNTSSRETFIDANEAYRLNIINKLVEPGNVLEEAIKLANQINQASDVGITQLIAVNNAFINQTEAYKIELDVILKNFRNLLNSD